MLSILLESYCVDVMVEISSGHCIELVTRLQSAGYWPVLVFIITVITSMLRVE